MTTQTAELKESTKPKNILDTLDFTPANNEIKITDEILKEIEWVDLNALKKQKVEEEPLHIMIYYRITDYEKQQKQKHGRITLSHFLSRKYGQNKKYKFGSLEGKVIFQVTDNEGLHSKLASKKYPKVCISNGDIVEYICQKHEIKQKSHSTYFKLKDLGNDFYLIDEIIK